ncbi:hypothetical protein ACFLRU_06645 [Bacteroidota bacterium]
MRTQTTLISLFILLFFSSCKQQSIKHTLAFDCETTNYLQQLIKIKDAKKTFELSIPENWKRELFVDTNESRLYCADTTKELNEAYIFDLGYFNNEIKFDNSFISNLTNELSNDNIIKKGTFNEKNRAYYYILSSSKNLGFPSKNLTIYLKNKNNGHYRLKLDVYGDKNTTQRFCEALSIFDKANLFQK